MRVAYLVRACTCRVPSRLRSRMPLMCARAREYTLHWLLLLVLLLLLLLLLFFVLASHVVAQPKRSRILLGVQLRLHVSYTYERAFLRVFSLPANMQLSFFFLLYLYASHAPRIKPHSPYVPRRKL